ncbi:MAG: enoyl-CoA hydratase/isomerase family protein [Sphingopyxis sp.]|nr:enoyl-CoA hydratase/isomerase family protein [Sphingopyxis sp.]
MTLRLTTTGAIATLRIDRPEKRNAFNQAMWDALPALVDQAMADPHVRVLILASAADGIFCAGADIGELLANKDDAAWRAANQAAINRAQHVLARAPKPTIAFVDGDCIGGGCGLSLACDIRIARSRARLGITPAKLGLVYPLHDTKLLVDLVGPGQAKRMLFTGALLGADEALRIGLVDMIADGPDDLAATIAAASPHSSAQIKGFVRRILDGQTDDNDETLTVFADAFTGADFLEGTTAFLEKRKPEF